MLVHELMESSGVKFGTSGARGLVSDMSDQVCYAYTSAFLKHLEISGQLSPGSAVAIAGDLRPSTPRIMEAVAASVEDSGYTALNCGHIPSPAVAHYGLLRRIPSIMVTGSHIPDDRNGIKFNKPTGEILKPDEQQIAAMSVELPSGRFDEEGHLAGPSTLPPLDPEARIEYVERYRRFFGANALTGLSIGLYEHSSVARDVLHGILEALGAQVTSLARSDKFIPVDTEAIRPEDRELALGWAAKHGFSAVVSTDGDGDRPLISDEKGNWLRGDVAGILCARLLGAQAVATPISSNTAVERTDWFEKVERTRIGSPFVIAAMEEMVKSGYEGVVGYEANGGFLTATPIRFDSEVLAPLPTRDAAIVIIAILAMARAKGCLVSELVRDLPRRYTVSDRVKAFPTRLAREKLSLLIATDKKGQYPAIDTEFGASLGEVERVNTTDGVRITFSSGEIVHFRPSGNAPELRCYAESGTSKGADALLSLCMSKLNRWKETIG